MLLLRKTTGYLGVLRTLRARVKKIIEEKMLNRPSASIEREVAILPVGKELQRSVKKGRIGRPSASEEKALAILPVIQERLLVLKKRKLESSCGLGDPSRGASGLLNPFSQSK